MGWFERPEFGANVGLIDEIYKQYLDNPESVSEAWREFFAENEPEEEPAQAPAQPQAQRPAATRERQPADRDGAVPLRGAAARIVEAMEASRAVPTATSVRVIPAKLLEVNRNVLNGHLRRHRGGKVSFTHLIGYAVVQALAAVPAMTSVYQERDGKPYVHRPEHVNLGIAVDTRRPDGSRTLLVPNIKQADTLDSAAFVRAYEEVVGKVKANKLT